METRRLETLKQIAAGVAMAFVPEDRVGMGLVGSMGMQPAGSHHRTHRTRPCIRP